MTWAKFGNVAPIEVLDDGRHDTPDGTKARFKVTDADGNDVEATVSHFRVPDSYSLIEQFIVLTSPGNGAVQAHTDAAPEWVMSDSPELANLLAVNYGCENRKPKKADLEEMGG